jgi:hypothetical protein
VKAQRDASVVIGYARLVDYPGQARPRVRHRGRAGILDLASGHLGAAETLPGYIEGNHASGGVLPVLGLPGSGAPVRRAGHGGPRTPQPG